MSEFINPKILGVGNSIVDVIVDVEESLLNLLELKKGSMQLCDIEFQEKILDLSTSHITVPGGSLANTMTTLGALEIETSFSSLVGQDKFGEIFKDSMSMMNVNTELIEFSKNHTGRSIILVTPDGERTMNTHLGACEAYGLEQAKKIDIKNYSHIFLEGYLLGNDQSFAGVTRLLERIDRSETEIMITLSDSFCVNQFLDRFRVVCSICNIIFANEKEFNALVDPRSTEPIPEVLSAIGISRTCEVVITKSGQGCTVVKGNEVLSFPTYENQFPKDLTGAGDQFAGAYLFGYLKGWNLKKRAKFANFLAGSIISQVGPRFSLNELKVLVDNFN